MFAAVCGWHSSLLLIPPHRPASGRCVTCLDMDAMKGHNYSYVFNFEQVLMIIIMMMMMMMMTLFSGLCPGACPDMDGGELAARVCLGQWHLHAPHIRGPDLHGQQVTILCT